MMQNIPCDVRPRGSSLPSLHGSWALALLATALLSFGVGAATAAFTLMNAVTRHSAPYASCETMLELSGALPLAPLDGELRDARAERGEGVGLGLGHARTMPQSCEACND